MPDPIYPDAIWYPGNAAGYSLGRNSMRAVVCHYTVGKNSLDLIARDALCQFLVSRGGDTPNSPDGRATVWQLAETDAKCWQAGDPFNGLGPGIEIEFYDEEPMFTPAQLEATGSLVHWLGSFGIPLDYYDTGGDNSRRVWDHHGFLSHRSCQSTADWHTDYWLREDWDRMVAAPVPVPPRLEDDEMAYTATDENNITWLFAGVWRKPITWDQANGLATLAQPVKYEGHISNEIRDAYLIAED
jgi:N-acetylmuramoyl-L-alanine amidase